MILYELKISQASLITNSDAQSRTAALLLQCWKNRSDPVQLSLLTHSLSVLCKVGYVPFRFSPTYLTLNFGPRAGRLQTNKDFTIALSSLPREWKA